MQSRARTSTQSALYLKEIERLKVFIPPLENQIEFRNLHSRIQIQKTRIINSLEESENLFKSLLQRAFKGEL